MKKLTNFFPVIILMVVIIISSSSFGQTPKLTDPEIASVAVTANQIDIHYAKLAKEKSKNSDILTFAATMATDHQSMIGQAAALFKKLGVTPKDNDLGKKLNTEAETIEKMLGERLLLISILPILIIKLAYHKAVIETVHNVLIPDKKWTSSEILQDGLWKMSVTQSSDYYCSIHPVMKGKIVMK